MKIRIAVCATSAILLSFSCMATLKYRALVRTITAEDISEVIHIIAADSMRGRDTGSLELKKTANYIANEFRRLALSPGASSESFLQHFTFEDGGDDIEGINVIGILRGSDPVLRNEYVVVSAHMDHVGVGRPIDGDSIYNGADDNASGTAAVIAIAAAYSRNEYKPKRSLLFLLVSGEEYGLHGSRWFTEHPVVPLEVIVADLNLDMVGRNWRDTIVAIGKRHSSLGALVDSVAMANPKLGFDVIDDLWPEQGYYFRSDHYNFARKGIPILFFSNGLHEDYHMPSDESDKIDFDKTARVARLVALTALAIANSPERPKWDADALNEIMKKR